MSYLVGKKVREFDSILDGTDCLYIKRIYGGSAFLFRVGRKSFCKCGVSDVYAIVRFNEIYHSMPDGFEYLKIEKSLKEMHDEFMFGEGSLACCGSEEFFKISALCYHFCLCKSFLDRVGVRGSWVCCSRRSKTKRGRKTGSKVISRNSRRINLDECLARREWNKNVARQKGMLSLFIEAEKEYCKETGEKFNLKECKEEWEKKK